MAKIKVKKVRCGVKHESRFIYVLGNKNIHGNIGFVGNPNHYINRQQKHEKHNRIHHGHIEANMSINQNTDNNTVRVGKVYKKIGCVTKNSLENKSRGGRIPDNQDIIEEAKPTKPIPKTGIIEG